MEKCCHRCFVKDWFVGSVTNGYSVACFWTRPEIRQGTEAAAIEIASKDVRDLQSLEAATPHERMSLAVQCQSSTSPYAQLDT